MEAVLFFIFLVFVVIYLVKEFFEAQQKKQKTYENKYTIISIEPLDKSERIVWDYESATRVVLADEEAYKMVLQGPEGRITAPISFNDTAIRCLCDHFKIFSRQGLIGKTFFCNKFIFENPFDFLLSIVRKWN